MPWTPTVRQAESQTARQLDVSRFIPSWAGGSGICCHICTCVRAPWLLLLLLLMPLLLPLAVLSLPRADKLPGTLTKIDFRFFLSSRAERRLGAARFRG